jgi:hypothetical protein
MLEKLSWKILVIRIGASELLDSRFGKVRYNHVVQPYSARVGSDPFNSVFFEPEKRDELLAILQRGEQVDTLTKVLVGRVMPDNDVIPSFDKQVLIYRFLSEPTTLN